jgi:hypothetical protein
MKVIWLKKGNYLDLQLKIQGLSDIIPKRDTTTILDLYQQYFVYRYMHDYIRNWWGATYKNEVTVTLTFVSMSHDEHRSSQPSLVKLCSDQ